MFSFRRLLGLDKGVDMFALRSLLGLDKVRQVSVVVEEPDSLGYYMSTRFKGASKQTKCVLLELMPQEEWEQMRESAWDGYILEGSYYRKDAV
jgi:hypothetical protein